MMRMACGCCGRARRESAHLDDAHDQPDGWTDDEAEPRPVGDEEYASWATGTAYHPDDAHAWEALGAKMRANSHKRAVVGDCGSRGEK